MNKKEDNNKVWISVEDLTNDPALKDNQDVEFHHSEDSEENGTKRRDFLKLMGFSLGAATVASCEIPVKKAIPYVVKPEEIVPGVATYFASAIMQGADVTPVLVKTREGRPIKLEGNPGTKENPTFTKGGTSARVQASVLSLYDTNRLKGPLKVTRTKAEKEGEHPTVESSEISWANLDKDVSAKLAAASNIRIVSHTNNSPTFKKAFETFKAKYPSAELVQYDPISCSAMLDANEKMFGHAWVPSYHFDKAKCIVSIGADFLGTWVSPIEYSADYSKNRKVTDKDISDADKKMSTHIQFESGMSMTGSNADHRVLIKPSEMGAAVGALYSEVCSLTGNAPAGSGPAANFSWGKATKAIKSTAKKLVDNNREALVVCGVNDVNIQMVVNEINRMIGAMGSTMVISKDEHSKQRLGRDGAIKSLVSDMNSGAVDAVLVCAGANPAYDLPELAASFATGLTKTKLSVSMGLSFNETATYCQYVAPDHHTLESWGDAEPKKGEYYLTQPTIAPLFKTRAAGESLLTWSGNSQSYHDFLRENWKQMFSGSYVMFQSFWNNSLHDGYFKTKNANAVSVNVEAPVNEEATDNTEQPTEQPTDNTDNTEEMTTDEAPVASSGIASALANLPAEKGGDLEVTFYESVQIGNGADANNPWLQEMPDPVMRTTWDNFIQIPLKWDGGSAYESLNGLKDGDLATIKVNGVEVTLPVFRQFGQMQGTVSIALGYGRTKAGKCGNGVGANLYPAVKNFKYSGGNASLSEKQGHDHLYANVQMHHTYGLTTTDESGSIKMHTSSTGEEEAFNVDEHMLGFQGSLLDRSVFFKSNAKDLDKEVKTLAKKREGYQYLNDKGLYPEHEIYKMGHHWGMAVDLSACTGCGACSIACTVENNVPVVGKFEVNKVHEMSWLRIDRYFYGDEETPNAVYMPMMCQHCDNAPCENVCPVAATNHSSEGHNQMTYNRCVGTRYCANNCPFKVRRFNWLDYTSADIFPSNEVDLNRGLEGREKDYKYMTDNLTRMVLNPDVTVRTRGVIEKCTFCIQRTQEAKLSAKVENRKLTDEDVVVACQQACPSGAIVFGDMNDPNSEVTKLKATKRAYIPIEETNVRSSVSYLMKVDNKDENFA